MGHVIRATCDKCGSAEVVGLPDGYPSNWFKVCTDRGEFHLCSAKCMHDFAAALLGGSHGRKD